MPPVFFLLSVAVLAFGGGSVSAERISTLFNDNWLFHRGDLPEYTCSSAGSGSAADFPINISFTMVHGLSETPQGNGSAAECAAICATNCSCQVWQYCPGLESPHVCGASSGSIAATCQTGLLADYGPGSWQTAGVGSWQGAARLQPPAPPMQSVGPASVGYDEGAFEHVMLPHDILAAVAPTNINSTFHQNEHGAIPFSNAWYRRHFSVPANTVLARLYFDGAYRSASVFLNGALAAQHEEGYTGFSVWLHNVSAPLILGGGDNVVAVYLASKVYTYELWGYEGSGIQRDVTLVLHTSAQSIAPWGVAAVSTVAGPVTAPSGACGAASASALVSPVVDVANAAAAAASVDLSVSVVAPDGTVVGSSTTRAALSAGGWARLEPPPIALATAALWSPACSPDAPRRPLYTLVTRLIESLGGKVLDVVNTTFGVRNVTFDANQGLFVNGFATKLRGVSMHQDFAGVGTFVPPRVQAYRVQRLLEIGCNSWRTAHNPVDTNLLNELDARGLLVWSEARFLRDFDIYVADAGDMVARDRNHPSIVLWSLCNENGCGESAGWEGATAGVQAGAMLATRFMAHMKTLDATRPITSNAHFTLGQNGSIMSVVDVMGLTYDYGNLKNMHLGRPDTPLLNGESASCQSDRGDDDVSGVMACSRDSWVTADQEAWDAGAFVWSGFDYRGECGGWPNTVSFYGILDLCGFDKGVAIWYKVWWGAAAGWPSFATLVEAWPPWSLPASGADVKITAASVAASLQLGVNGVPVGAPVPVPRLGFATWTVPFVQGNYTVTSFDAAGAQLGVFVSQSPGPAVALRAIVDWPGSAMDGSLVAGRRDAALVEITVVDAHGVIVRSASVNCTFALTGPGELLGLGNGDHANHFPGQGTSWMPTYYGRARAILRSAAAATGTPLQLTVTADGLEGAAVDIGVVSESE
jgi:hypothetical protein